MPCVQFGNAIVCIPKAHVGRRRMRCPTCRRVSTFMFRDYEWYGRFQTCLTCGDQWSDGDRLDRPFRRGWRQENIRKAKKMLREEAGNTIVVRGRIAKSFKVKSRR
jgi:putative transposon-encoded protein